MITERYNIDWKRFCRFLKENNCYGEFCENFLKGQVKIKEFKKAPSLVTAFVWDATNEGHEFWETINSKWREGDCSRFL